jgi:hypothetical protein
MPLIAEHLDHIPHGAFLMLSSQRSVAPQTTAPATAGAPGSTSGTTTTENSYLYSAPEQAQQYTPLSAQPQDGTPAHLNAYAHSDDGSGGGAAKPKPGKGKKMEVRQPFHVWPAVRHHVQGAATICVPRSKVPCV